VINGSLNKHCEFAEQKKFRHEVPKHAFWVTTPEHSLRFHLLIQPMDRDVEGC
jgi:hypothetical protein